MLRTAIKYATIAPAKRAVVLSPMNLNISGSASPKTLFATVLIIIIIIGTIIGNIAITKEGFFIFFVSSFTITASVAISFSGFQNFSDLSRIIVYILITTNTPIKLTIPPKAIISPVSNPKISPAASGAGVGGTIVCAAAAPIVIAPTTCAIDLLISFINAIPIGIKITNVTSKYTGIASTKAARPIA